MGLDSKYVDVNGVRLAYVEHRTATSSAPLVFVHGYALRSSGDLYEKLFANLSREFVVYAIDLRGHGGSNGPESGPWSLAANADDVASFVEQLGLQGAVYAGHSIGGYIGMLTEIRHPGTFSILCLLATGPVGGGRSNPEGIADIFIQDGGDQAVMRDTLGPMYLRPDPRGAGLAAAACSVIASSVHEAFFLEYQSASLEDRIAEINSAVLLVNGARDTVVPPEEQHLTARGLRRSKEVIFSDEGHMLPLEAADLCAREITNFVRFDAPELLAV
jgi:pimeloyl-ACP methyl ester carboxylesterase